MSEKKKKNNVNALAHWCILDYIQLNSVKKQGFAFAYIH